MAYMSQEKKAQIAPRVKAICKQYGVKASLAVRFHSTLVLTISEGPVDFFADVVDVERGSFTAKRLLRYIDVNPYHWRRDFTGKSLAFLSKVMPILNDGNWDKSDLMTDHFDVGWYVDVHVGRWNKPYRLTSNEKKG